MSPALARTRRPDRAPDIDPATLIDLLDNESTRRILSALGTDPLTARELASRTDLPLSTLYRRLGELKTTCLVEESLRLNPGGQHAAQYARGPCDVVITIDDGVTVRVDAAPPR
ncbi:MAG: helix-turn-helix domain-containing protein [Halobacteriaceae archaeon]